MSDVEWESDVEEEHEDEGTSGGKVAQNNANK